VILRRRIAKKRNCDCLWIT